MTKSKNTIKPRGKWVLIKPDPLDNKVLPSGLVTPSTVEQEQKAYGKILDIGSDVRKDIKKGDSVIYMTFAGQAITSEGNEKDIEYMLVLDDDIIAHKS